MSRVKFTTQTDPSVLADVRAIASHEGRQFQAVVEEALREWVDRKRRGQPRAEVLTHLRASLDRNRELYRRLGQ